MEIESPGHSQDGFVSAINSLEYGYYLKSKKISDLKETIRYISEELIWSDQNKSTFFKYYLDSEFKFRNCLNLFSKILVEIKSKELQIQLIQSANILIHNLASVEDKSKKKSEFLLGSDFYSDLLTAKFDFSDDDIAENYMSFLKGTAANLPSFLLLSYVVHTKFAFFSKALSFFSHKDAMLKNAARTGIMRVVRLNDPKIINYLKKTDFIFQVYQKVLNNWKKFHLLVRREEKFSREYFVNILSDDLCYISDLMDTNEDMEHEISNKFIAICIPWLVTNIEYVSKHKENFNGLGFILTCCFDFIKSNYLLNLLATVLFSNQVPQRILSCIKGDDNFSYDFMNDDEKTANQVKGFIVNIMKSGKNTAGVLIVINKVIGNQFIYKRVFYDCALLLHQDVKPQNLIKKVLQKDETYASDSVLTSLLLQILNTDQPVFNAFLACRIFLLCKVYPEEVYLKLIKSKIEARVSEFVEQLKELLRAGKVDSYLMVECFEAESKYFKNLKFEAQVKFPTELLHLVDLSTSVRYRVPVSIKEKIGWYLCQLMIIGYLQHKLLGEKRFFCLDEILLMECEREIAVFDGKDGVKVKLNSFFVDVEKNLESFRLRISNLKVLQENDPLILTLLSNISLTPIQIEFFNQESSTALRKLIEKRKKDITSLEFIQILKYINSFAITN